MKSKRNKSTYNKYNISIWRAMFIYPSLEYLRASESNGINTQVERKALSTIVIEEGELRHLRSGLKNILIRKIMDYLDNKSLDFRIYRGVEGTKLGNREAAVVLLEEAILINKKAYYEFRKYYQVPVEIYVIK